MTTGLPESLSGLLTTSECLAIDQTLLPTRDRFSIRIAVYAQRYLKQVGEGLGVAIADLTPDQITAWLRQDEQLQTQEHLDASFVDWFSTLLVSSMVPLEKIAQVNLIPIEQVTFDQIVGWFQAQAKAALMG